MSNSKHPVAIGTIVASVEAPTVLYRVTSRSTVIDGQWRILPYRRQGDALWLLVVGSTLVAHGSVWRVVS